MAVQWARGHVHYRPLGRHYETVCERNECGEGAWEVDRRMLPHEVLRQEQAREPGDSERRTLCRRKRCDDDGWTKRGGGSQNGRRVHRRGSTCSLLRQGLGYPWPRGDNRWMSAIESMATGKYVDLGEKGRKCTPEGKGLDTRVLGLSNRTLMERSTYHATMMERSAFTLRNSDPDQRTRSSSESQASSMAGRNASTS